MALLLLVAPDLSRNLPSAALAALVISSAIGLFEVTDLKRIYRIQRWEFWLSIVCFAGVAVLGAIPGIGLAVVIAVVEFLWMAAPHLAVLGALTGSRAITTSRDIPKHADSGLVLFRWDAPCSSPMGAVQGGPRGSGKALRRYPGSSSRPNPDSVDITAADFLEELDEALHQDGIELCFAELKDPVKDKLRRFGLFARFEKVFFPTIEEAVDSYLETHKVDWVDWEDKSPARKKAVGDLEGGP